jgi:DNA-binding HxlR family transcriptional regulator
MIEKLQKVFESRVRLGVMSILMANETADFNTLKEMLDLTDGNLASHLTALEKKEMIDVYKEFVGRKPKTNYAATILGKQLFKSHLKALEKLISGI